MPVTRHWQRELDRAAPPSTRQSIPRIEPIDLDAVVVAVLMPIIPTMDAACDAVVAEVEKRAGRSLMPGELAKVYIATGCEFNRQRQTVDLNVDERQACELARMVL